MDTWRDAAAAREDHRERLRRALGRLAPSVTVPLLAALAGTFVSSGRAEAQERSSPPEIGDTPVLLGTVVRVALERNRDVLDAEYQVAVAGEQVAEAWSTVYPTLDLSSSFTRNVAPQVSFLPAQIFNPNATEGEFIPVQFGADNIWNLSVNAEQKLFDPRIFVGVGAAARFERVQREALRGRTQQAVTRIRMAFYDLLLGQEEVRLTENSLERVRQALAETRAMQEAGLAPVYDVLRLEVELANLEPNLRRAHNRMGSARRELAVELALDPEVRFEAAGSLARIDLDDFDANSPANRNILAFHGVPAVDEAEITAFVRRSSAGRSDIRQLEMTRELRHTELRIEQVEYLPKVFAFGSYGLAAQQNGTPDFFGSQAQRGSSKQVGLRVTIPIFSGFGRDARIDQKRAALRQADTQTRMAADRAEVQLRNLVDLAHEAHARTVGQRLAVGQAQRGYDIASAQYREGLGSRLELTDAEVALRQSEFNYAQAVYDYLAARARLDEAAGRVPLVDVEPLAGGEGGAAGR
ncbi:MAG: TolC family protein [Gemmatimonadota bacterium]|nr:TolC family protein [Gemmatimonadota bacterium]MDE2985967.1 TolC family protein [Gemmatimonadota bacterium]